MKKTVAIDSFEHNNLVLVDEGHRGSSGDVWGRHRRSLARDGFTFEYSATLGQAAASRNYLATEYAKSIIFDYSYRHFYGDGYGKDYRILNLPEADDDDTRELYLTACILSFYQQRLLFEDEASEAAGFNIENPLCVFVGSSVNAIRTQNKRQVSDVVDLLLFLARFTSPANKQAALNRIKKLKSGNTSLLSASGKDVLANMFPFIAAHSITANQVYNGIMSGVFNASIGAAIHVEELKGADGEIALTLGDNEPFGIINVGDAPRLCKLCEEHEELIVSSRNFTGSLFHTINNSDSSIHILIGSKRFSEGWNSWRVSTMGLMNVGQGEGSQIIQLFGRGVRLWGLNKGLKRHSALTPYQEVEPNEKLSFLETLNIFGVRANYMEQFKQYLEKEGIPTDDIEQIIVPVKKNLGSKKLKTIKIKKGINFTKGGNKPVLEFRTDRPYNKITLDYYPHIQSQVAKGITVPAGTIAKNSSPLPSEYLPLLDYDALFFDLQRLKKDRGWFNLCISRNEIEKILKNDSWYEILIPEEQLCFDSYEKIFLWQGIASSLIQKYCDQFYKACKSEWEAPHREYKYLKANDANFIDEYNVLVNKTHTTLIYQLNDIKQQIRKRVSSGDKTFGAHTAIFFDKHLYQPLIFAGNSDIRVKPVPLNEGEKRFISSLRGFYNSTRTTPLFSGREMYVLRNMSKGHGIGFFEAGNFYPDFILWVIEGDQQSINFIDPKGIMNIAPNSPKLDFYNTIKTIEKEMGDDKVALNSFIISATPYNDIKDRFAGMEKSDFKDRNILFQQDSNCIDNLFKKIIPQAV